jgi:hypothetical protein
VVGYGPFPYVFLKTFMEGLALAARYYFYVIDIMYQDIKSVWELHDFRTRNQYKTYLESSCAAGTTQAVLSTQ